MRTKEKAKLTFNRLVPILILIFIFGCNTSKPTLQENNESKKKITFVYSESGDTTTIAVEEKNGNLVYEGDILVYEAPDSIAPILKPNENDSLPPELFSVGVQRRFRWANGIIPYKIQENHPYDSLIREAISEMESLTNLCFKEKSSGRYVSIENNPNEGCYSTIGDPTFSFLNIERDARINLDSSCGSKGVILHELGHTVGLFHEHTRSDRDNYVDILWDNIEDGEKHNFAKRNGYWGKDIHSYDCGSIMHYGPGYFSKNGNNTIENINCQTPLGQRNSLSPEDIRGINSMYYWTTGCPQALDSLVLNAAYQIEALHSGKALSIASGDNIVQSTRINHPSLTAERQTFKIIPAGDNFYYIQNQESKEYLTFVGSSANCNANFPLPNSQINNIIQKEKFTNSSCLESTQQWKFIDLGNQTYHIVSKVTGVYNSWYIAIHDGSHNNDANVTVGKDPKNKDYYKFKLTPAPAARKCDAAFISQIVPDNLASPQEVDVSLTFKNTGNTIWSSVDKLSPVYNEFFIASIEVDRIVETEEEITFNFKINFTQPGVYKFQWSMYKFAECNGFFGQKSPLIEITVGANANCDEILANIKSKETLLSIYQRMLADASPGQKAGIITSIDNTAGEINALERLAEQNGCL